MYKRGRSVISRPHESSQGNNIPVEENNMPKDTFALGVILLILLFNVSAGMGFALASVQYINC
jgi:hypothetical protein